MSVASRTAIFTGPPPGQRPAWHLPAQRGPQCHPIILRVATAGEAPRSLEPDIQLFIQFEPPAHASRIRRILSQGKSEIRRVDSLSAERVEAVAELPVQPPARV